VTRRRLLRGLEGAAVRGLGRRAKHAVFDLGDRRLVVQPGMTGSLMVHERPLTPDESRYAVLSARLDDGRRLVYRDVRRLGTLLLLDQRGWQAYDRSIGPEPLDRAFTAERLGEILGGSRQAVKKVLMDQRRLAGIGNIYANEALFAAGIDPSRAANRVRPEEASRLRAELVRILRAAIKSNGTTFRDYRTGTGESGNFQLELFVYGREGERCKVCGTRLVGTHLIDARISVLCHRCQS
jgi:formamidopyrimidine-DNA glycosylase